MAQDQAFAAFLEGHLKTTVPLEKELNLVSWEAARTGSPEAEAKTEELDVRFQSVFASREDFALLKSMAAGPWNDPLLQRQHKLLLDAYTGLQIEPDLIGRIAAVETRLRALFNTHRGTVGGQPIPDGEIKRILHESNDTTLRKEAWEASKSIGPMAKDSILEAVALRNDAARSLGYSDYYTMRISLDDLDVDRVYAVLDELEAASDGPWERAKGALDAGLAQRFGLAFSELRPWHYQDPFFQEAPPSEADLDAFYPGKDMEAIARRFFADMGLPVEGILSRSDLYEAKGKNQHAFCTDIDRSGDVRTLCNLRPNASSIGTLCHELGHAVYDENFNFALPWELRRAAHGLVTEAVAIFMEFFPRKGQWLSHYVGANPTDADHAERLSARQQAVADLVITRWFLVMCHFERALYANPIQDLDTLWWDLVERFQRVNRPDDRHAPDWAAKIHIALYPVYYHLYPLGGCVASMLRNVMRQRFPAAANGLGDPALGAYLRESVFAHGAALPWETLLEQTAGEPLTTRHWAREWDEAV
ncbi:MAG TPA: M2 family metallopeptidase [Armatimonadota bacterium]|jgi:peptidyl-dipeptidase A